MHGADDAATRSRLLSPQYPSSPTATDSTKSKLNILSIIGSHFDVKIMNYQLRQPACIYQNSVLHHDFSAWDIQYNVLTRGQSNLAKAAPNDPRTVKPG